MQDELTEERWLEWMKTQPHMQQANKRDWEDLKFSQRVADFIYKQPKKQLTQRRLLRHFSNKREKDLVKIQDWLRMNYDITSKSEGKSIVYYSTMKNIKGKYFREGT